MELILFFRTERYTELSKTETAPPETGRENKGGNHMKKKLLALTMAAAMTAALLAGCGGTPAPSSTGKSDPVSSTAVPAEPVEIRLMAYNAETSRATYLALLEETFPNTG